MIDARDLADMLDMIGDLLERRRPVSDARSPIAPSAALARSGWPM